MKRIGFTAAVLCLLCTAVLAQQTESGKQSREIPAMHAWYRLFDHSVQVTVDWKDVDTAKFKGGSLDATLKDGEKAMARASATHMPTHLLSIPLPGKLAGGNYVVRADLVDAAGKTYSLDLPFIRTKSEWEDNGIGVTDKLIPPWTPMTARGNVAICWAREYTFGSLGLPAQIISTQPEPTRGAATRKLLAAPAAIVVDTPNGRLGWRTSEPTVKLRTEAYVDVTASGETTGGEIRATLAGTLEFDGFYKFTLRLEPVRPTRVKSIRIEVPIPDDLALLFNVSGESMRSNNAFLDFEGRPDGELWNSYNSLSLQRYLSAGQKRLLNDLGPGGGMKRGYMGQYYPPHPYIGTFYPHLWLGNDDRGIAFLADSDKGWVEDYTKPCQDVIRKNGRTILRLLIVNKPTTLDKPIETTLSLQATPVRPRPSGGSWKNVTSYGWSQFDMPHLYTKWYEPYKEGKGYKWFTSDEAKAQDRWWRYFCFYSDRIHYGADFAHPQDTTEYAADWDAHSEEWLSGSSYGWYGPASVHVPSNADWRLWAYKQWHDIAGMKGIYYDNTYLHLVAKLQTGIAWEDDSGTVHPAFACFSARDYIKRVRTYFTQQGPAPVLYTHMTDAPIIGYLGLADKWLDGENGGRPDCTLAQEVKWGTNLDFVDRWANPGGLSNLRVTLGRQWGVAPTYLYSWGTDPTHAVLGMFDMDNCYTALNNVKYEFGIDKEDCRHMPYWDSRKPAQVSGGNTEVFVTTWTRPGRARVMVSNLSRHDKAVNVNVKLKTLGLPNRVTAVDEQTGEAIRFSGGTIRGLNVQVHNYRVVLLAAPGTFKPVPIQEKSLEPRQRLTRLCDDFSKVENDRKPAKSIDTWRGMMRIKGNEFGGLIRPFNEDNCSVQAKVMASGSFWDSYPQISLYWNKDSYVSLKAGAVYPTENGPKIESFTTVDGKRTSAQGPVAGAASWIKIGLKPQSVEFYCSLDGKAWTLINSVPRKGLEGAPSYLFVGRFAGLDPQGQTTGKDRATGIVYFDDLIVGRD